MSGQVLDQVGNAITSTRTGSGKAATGGKQSLDVWVQGDETSAGGAGAATVTIYNLSAPVAGTEYSQTLSATVKALRIRVRGSANAQYSFNSGQSSTVYETIPRGANAYLPNLRLSGATLYIQTDQNNQVIEIVEMS